MAPQRTRFIWAYSILAGALFFLSHAPSLKADDFQPVSQDELRMTSEPLAPGAPAVILYRQVDRQDALATYAGTTTTIAEAGGTEKNYFRIKILTDSGLKYANVEVPLDKWTAIDVVNIHARTIHPDGSIAEFNGTGTVKEVDNGPGQKYQAMAFTLPDVTVGCVIEYYYTVMLSEVKYDWGIWGAPQDSHWILSDELFTKQAKFSLLPSRGDPNNPVHVRWSWNYLPQGTQPPQQGSDHVIRMELSNIPPVQTEDFMPPVNEVKSRVDFAYSDDFETDPTKFWKEHAKKLYNTVEAFLANKSMTKEAAEIISPGDSAEVKLHKIYARVQQMRNTSYLPPGQKPEAERTDVTVNVQDVWKRGFGDSAQLDWVFLALVRAAGFEAYPVYASNRNNYFFNQSKLDVGELEARLVLVKADGNDFYFDPGTACTPFGLLDWPETDVAALLLDREGGSWINTPLPPSAASRVVRKADLTIAKNATDLEGKVTLTLTGLAAMDLRHRGLQEKESDRKKYLENDFKSQIPGAGEVELTNSPDWAGSDTPFTAEFNVKVSNWVTSVGQSASLPLGIFDASEKGLFQSESRVYPIYFNYPVQKEDDITVIAPVGWRVTAMPPPANLDVKVALYSMTVAADQGTVRVHREFNSDFLIVQPKLYPALRNFFQVVETGDQQYVALHESNTTASE